MYYHFQTYEGWFLVLILFLQVRVVEMSCNMTSKICHDSSIFSVIFNTLLSITFSMIRKTRNQRSHILSYCCHGWSILTTLLILYYQHCCSGIIVDYLQWIITIIIEYDYIRWNIINKGYCNWLKNDVRSGTWSTTSTSVLVLSTPMS